MIVKTEITYTLAETMASLGIKQSTLYRLIERYGINCICDTYGRRRAFPRAEVERMKTALVEEEAVRIAKKNATKRTCKHCGLEKPLDLEHWYATSWRGEGTYDYTCIECRREKSRKNGGMKPGSFKTSHEKICGNDNHRRDTAKDFSRYMSANPFLFSEHFHCPATPGNIKTIAEQILGG